MHQTISERWNRISLRTKITGVTVLMLTLGLLVSGIGTAAMLRSYVEEQTKGKLEAIASGDLMKYFTDEGDDATSGTDLDNLAFRPAEDVFVAVYDEATGEFLNHNWRDRAQVRAARAARDPHRRDGEREERRRLPGLHAARLLGQPDVPGRRGPR